MTGSVRSGKVRTEPKLVGNADVERFRMRISSLFRISQFEFRILGTTTDMALLPEVLPRCLSHPTRTN
jgi:hypothetical protein